jgi:lipid-A-disaccharide synthase
VTVPANSAERLQKTAKARPRVCIITADHSGDAVAANLARALRERVAIDIAGAGGSAMRDAGIHMLGHTTRWAVLGVVGWIPAVFPATFANWAVRYRVRRWRPDLLVCIDSGGFNVPIARTLRWLWGQKVLYYIPPRSWSRTWRVKPLREADYVAAPFPWNAAGDDGTGRVRFVGHPAADLRSSLPPAEEARARLGLDPQRPTVALLPGSRRGEIGVHVPILLEAAKRLREKRPGLQAVLSRAPNVARGRLDREIRKADTGWVCVGEAAGLPLRAADMAFVCMGTATVEACALGIPMVAFYRGNWIQHLEFKIKPPKTAHFSLPNLLAGEHIVVEVTGEDVCANRLAAEGLRLLGDAQARARTSRRLLSVAEALGGPGATERAAQAVIDALRGNWHSQSPGAGDRPWATPAEKSAVLR